MNVGDSLTFDIAGESFDVQVASIRKVKWDSFQPNFFVVFAPGVLEKTAGTYITSANLKPGEARSLSQLARRFPSVSIFDIDDLLAQVRSVLDKAVLAVQSVFVFTLFAGLTVLLAAVQSSRDERRYESAMLRTLGARRATVLQGVLSEFTTLGLLSGFLAAAGASIAAYFIDTRVLQLHYKFDWWVCVEGVVGGACAGGRNRLACDTVGCQSTAVENTESVRRRGVLAGADQFASSERACSAQNNASTYAARISAGGRLPYAT